ncbi:hypothetical protein KP509_37G025300 [Ceratopteris richardii]|nr:hypothetical protein KP509_37G025300 [Ceratopteris richardii]
MILCVHGFPSNVHALQFEWAWQHPLRSIAVRNAASELKRRGAQGQVLLLFTMLNLPEWNSMNLVVNFLSTKHQHFLKGCPSLPLQMQIKIGPLDDLPCYRFPHSELSASADEGEMEDDDESECDGAGDSAIQNVVMHCNTFHVVDRNDLKECDNVLAEIANRATIPVRRIQQDAVKSKQQAGLRHGIPEDSGKVAQKIKKSIGVVSPSKRKGRQKSSKRKSLINNEDLCNSLVTGTHLQSMETVETISTSPSKLEPREACNQSEDINSLRLMPASSLEQQADHHATDGCTSVPREDKMTPTGSPNNPSGDISVVWDLSPLWSHVSYKGQTSEVEILTDGSHCNSESEAQGVGENLPPPNNAAVSDTVGLSDVSTVKSPSALCDETPQCGMRKAFGLDKYLHIGDEGIDTEAVRHVIPLGSPIGHQAGTRPRESRSRKESSPVFVVKSNDIEYGSHFQFTPLWSPSPLPSKQDSSERRHVNVLPFELADEYNSGTNCSFSSSPLPCFPDSKSAIASSKLGLSQAKVGADFNSMEIIDLTDSPVHESCLSNGYMYV